MIFLCFVEFYSFDHCVVERTFNIKGVIELPKHYMITVIRKDRTIDLCKIKYALPITIQLADAYEQISISKNSQIDVSVSKLHRHTKKNEILTSKF